MNKITTVKELPDSEKPYEKFLTYGPEYLSDAELLAVIIRSGTSGLKSVEVAQNLLNDGHRNLLNLYDIPFEKMQKIRGIGIPEPSHADDVVTKRILNCGQLMGIPLSDHVIIGDHSYFSYRENNRIVV